MSAELIKYYFPEITDKQLQQFEVLGTLYPEWNQKINVVSRKSIEELYINHVLHSLGIAKVYTFLEGHRVLDVGTGGGFPGIPLAILFPETSFHLVDSIGKKIKVVEDVIHQLDLTNVTAEQERVEKLPGKYHFIVSRAVTEMPKFMGWIRGRITKQALNEAQTIPNGILYLKGGDLTSELATVHKKEIYPLSHYFKEDFFETKKVVYIPLGNAIKEN